jgi:dephospho-CoA kinase
MKVFGITGLMGTGKTTASDYLKSKKIPVLDADEATRRVVDKNTAEGKDGFAKIYKAFGPTVLNSLGQLDRPALRKRIAANPHEKSVVEDILNPLIHEYVRKKMTEWKSANAPLAFIEGARIFETGLDKVVAGVVHISAPESERIKRIVKRDTMGKDEAALMIRAQGGAEYYSRFSKFEWKNDKKPADLEKLIDAFISSVT